MRYPVEGVGLGLRRELMQPLNETPLPEIAFLEVAPENWMRLGGALGKRFRAFTERYPFVCHGLSLSLGSPAPLDEAFVLEVRTFLQTHGIKKYTEHLSYCSDHGHLYDLMPIPFTAQAVDYVAARIQRVQELLGQRIAVENVSYYAAPGQEMTELEFLRAVIEKADCELLLDVNNIYVNSVNHRYDARAFLHGLKGLPVSYVHIAGHYDEAPDLLVDTHGASVKPGVWSLLTEAYRVFGVMPTLLERDFNMPSMTELKHELQMIAQRQEQASELPGRSEALAG